MTFEAYFGKNQENHEILLAKIARNFLLEIFAVYSEEILITSILLCPTLVFFFSYFSVALRSFIILIKIFLKTILIAFLFSFYFTDNLKKKKEKKKRLKCKLNPILGNSFIFYFQKFIFRNIKKKQFSCIFLNKKHI